MHLRASGGESNGRTMTPPPSDEAPLTLRDGDHSSRDFFLMFDRLTKYFVFVIGLKFRGLCQAEVSVNLEGELKADPELRNDN